MENTTFNPDNYWENRLDKIKGLEGVGFKKLGPSFNRWAYKVRRHVFLKEIKKLNLPVQQAAVLDIGAGTGFYIQVWRELGAKDITGVDITPTAIANLVKTFPEQHFFLSDIGAENFNTKQEYKQYNLVSAMDVLFHIVDDSRFDRAIANIAAITKKGGYFIYSDLFLNDYTFRGESQVCHSKKHLFDLFEKNGFELVTFKPFMYLTNKPIDTKNPLLKAYWFLLENSLYALPFMGHVFGPLFYPLEMLLLNTSKDSPTTEFTIFRKK